MGFSFSFAENSKPRVLFETNYGKFIVEMDREKAPGTVNNFLSYVTSGFYNGTIFHRVIKGFMIQGGGFKVGMMKKNTNSSIENEAFNGLKNRKYTIAMARTGDPHSATSQFFINSNNNNFLNYRTPSGNGWGYCVFGRVVKGHRIVDKIENQPTTTKGMYKNVPIIPVLIQRIILMR